MKRLHHVTLISFRDETPESVREELIKICQNLQKDCGGIGAGILSWNVDRNLDMRKEMHIVEIAVFENDDALQEFRVHPAHQAFTDRLREVADWYVGDIMAEYP